MERLMDTFLSAPVYVLLTACGIAFLFAGVVRKFKDWFDLDQTSRILLSAMGVILIIVGIWLQHSSRNPTATMAPTTPPKSETADPYKLGTSPDREIDKIIEAAENRFDDALGKRKASSDDWEPYETNLKYSECREPPLLLRLQATRSTKWQCIVAPETSHVRLVVMWLDELAKPIAKALPSDWEVMVGPRPGTSDIRFQARDSANRIFVRLHVAEAKDRFRGLLTFEID